METRKMNSISEGRSTRSETSDNLSERTSALPIPTDLTIDIFSRLPSRSIAVCRCVSKSWASTLRSQDFTDFYLTKSSTRPQILYARKKDGELFFFSSPQPPQNSSSSPPPPPLSADPLMHLRDFTSCKISGLVHGLVCLQGQRISTRESDMVPVLYNPTTGQTLILPKLKTTSDRVKCFLGYDPVDKQFKVLSMTEPLSLRQQSHDIVSEEEHQVLTLGTGELSSWRMIQCCIPLLYTRGEGICINGVLYFTSIHHGSGVIVCFDVRSEKFRLIEAKGPLGIAVLLGDMVNCNGRLGFTISANHQRNVGFISGESARFKFWVLDDVEKQDWSHRVYELPAEWKNVVGKHLLNFVGLTRTNEIVLSSCYAVNPSYLFYFNPERNSVVRAEIKGVGMDGSRFAVLRTFLDHVEDVKLYAKVH